MSHAPPLTGKRVALLETREAERLSALLREQGAEIVACPAVAVVDAADPGPVDAWLERFVAAPCDDLVLLTGEGLTRLHSRAARSGRDRDFTAALARARTIIRGPKPARALRALGLAPQLRAATATTDGVIALLQDLDLRGRRVGVQLYPGADDRLPRFLTGAGADPDPVTPYAYAAGASEAALAALIERIAAGGIDAVAFTSAAQVRRLFEAAAAQGWTARLATGLRPTAIAAIGPVVAAELRRYGLDAAIVPDGAFFMKPLVTAIATALGRRP